MKTHGFMQLCLIISIRRWVVSALKNHQGMRKGVNRRIEMTHWEEQIIGNEEYIFWDVSEMFWILRETIINYKIWKFNIIG